MPINYTTAYNVRVERKLRLPVHGAYESPRLKEIATRQSEILDELAKLDEEIAAGFDAENEEEKEGNGSKLKNINYAR